VTVRDTLLAVLVAAIWGFAFVVIRLGVDEMPPLVLTAMRFLFSALPAVFFLPPPKARVGLVIAFGTVLGIIKFGLLFSALKLGMTAGLASLLMQMQVFFTIGLATLLFHDRPSPIQLIGALVAMGGVAAIGLAKGSGAPVVPFLMVLAAAFMWGVANIIAKKAQGADMLAFVVWASLVPPLPLLALSVWIDGADAVWQPLTHPTWFAALLVFILAIPTTVFAFSVWTRLLKTYPTAVVTPFALLVPVFGFLSGWAFLGEAMTLPVIIGAGLVLLGLAINVFGPDAIRRLR
jgi:O-acetylserine/cysteine efflux transporter